MKVFHSQNTDLQLGLVTKFKLSLLILAVLISLSATAKHIHKVVNPQPKATKSSAEEKGNTLDDRDRQAMSTSGKVTFRFNIKRNNLLNV